LTASKVNEFRAVISPDGSQVAYGVNGDFYTMASTGGAETLVCKGCGANVVAWSPDGTKLLFYRGKPGRHATFDLATRQIQDAVWHSTADIFNGRISPDGKWLAFTCVTEAKRPVVYIAKLDGSQGGKPESWIPIAEGPFNSFWSPDGNLLYFHSPERGELAARKLHPETRMPLGDPFIVQRFQATRQFPLFSAKGMVKDALYFVMSESTSNIWLADPVGK
jgi:Tol biopolymer transport system component